MGKINECLLVLVIITALLLPFSAGIAASASANVSLSFSSTESIPPESLVSYSADNPNYVELANTSNESRILGVAVSSNQSLLAINTTNNTQVAVSGVAVALASTLNGDIHVGDHISASSLDGVGMKASSKDKVIGIAQSDLTATAPSATILTLPNKGQAYVGPVTLNLISNYQMGNGQPLTSTGFLGTIQNAANTISGHPVSTLQAILSFMVALVAILALAALVYATVRGGLISIGRNPLARTTIFHYVEQLMIVALSILVIAVVIIYLTLR